MEFSIIDVAESVGELSLATLFVFKKVPFVLFVRQVVGIGAFPVLFVLGPITLVDISVEIVVCSNSLLPGNIRIWEKYLPVLLELPLISFSALENVVACSIKHVILPRTEVVVPVLVGVEALALSFAILDHANIYRVIEVLFLLDSRLQGFPVVQKLAFEFLQQLLIFLQQLCPKFLEALLSVVYHPGKTILEF